MSKAAIWKISVPVDDQVHEFELPKNAWPIHVNCQDTLTLDHVQVWFQVEIDEERREKQSFKVVGTGHPFDDAEFYYVGTGICAGGGLVWHVLAQNDRIVTKPDDE